MKRTFLLKQKNFYPLFWTQFCGALNDNFLKNSLIILITFRDFSIAGLKVTEMVPLAGGIFILPFFLFSGMAGQIADKYEKSRIIRRVKLAEIAILGFAAVGFATGHFGFLLVVLFAMGVHSSFFGPVKYGIVPQHVPERDLVGANALIEAGTFVAILLGTICGGLVTALPRDGIWMANVAMLALAAFGYAMSRRIPPAPARAPDLHLARDPVRPTWEILAFACSRRETWWRIVAASWFWCFGAAILLALPPFVKTVMASDERALVLVLTVWSVGIGAGSLLCGYLSKAGVERALVPLGALGMSVFTVLFGWAGTPDGLWSARGWLALPAIFLVTVSAGLYIVPLTTLMQANEEPSHVSRVIAANNIVNALFIVLASVFLFVTARCGVTLPGTFVILAGLNAAFTGLCFYLAPEYPRRFATWLRAVARRG